MLHCYRYPLKHFLVRLLAIAFQPSAARRLHESVGNVLRIVGNFPRFSRPRRHGFGRQAAPGKDALDITLGSENTMAFGIDQLEQDPRRVSLLRRWKSLYELTGGGAAIAS